MSLIIMLLCDFFSSKNGEFLK